MNREVEEGFIRNTARKVYQELSQKQKDYIFWHPSTIDHMFGFGMVIRNKYIYDAHVRCEADHVSSLEISADTQERGSRVPACLEMSTLSSPSRAIFLSIPPA